MAGNTVHLSLLSRGVGEVKKNGHEKVDVVLEPEDYFNYTQDSSRLYLPPIPPKYNSYMDTSRSQGSTHREVHELYMPKTFITRKGALLLFSEDYANKTRSTDYRPNIKNTEAQWNSMYPPDALRTWKDMIKPHEAEDESSIKAGLSTVEDLSRSILSYGNRKESEVNLFVYDKKKTPRKFRPGYSAKRYLSRLTRSFDDSFVDKLLSSGYVSEKTLFHPNALLPHLRRRINDDLSAYPPPYRVMKHMLLAPGVLSGYTFYTGIPDVPDTTRLEEIGEEDEAAHSEKSSRKLEIIDTKDGVAKSVTYSDLSKEEKEKVLADLLVKSAMNHALEQQKEIIDQSQLDESTVVIRQLSEGEIGAGDQMTEAKWGLNMTEAVKSYIESQVTTTSQQDDYSDTTYLTPLSFRGAKIPQHSVKSFEVNPFETIPAIPKKGESTKRETAPKRKPLPSEITGSSKEFIGGIPVASLKDTQSISSYASSHKSSSGFSKSSLQDSYAPIQAPPLSPIMDVNSEAYGLSREATFNPQQPIPPIMMRANLQVLDPGLGVPGLAIQPPTPQVSNLTSAGQPEPTTDQLSDRMEDTGRSSVSDSHSYDMTTGTESDTEAKHQHRRQRRKKPVARTTSMQSLGEGGMVPSGGIQLGSSTESIRQPDSVRSYNSMRGGALKRSKASSSVTSSRKDHLESDSVSGAVIFGPEGVVKVGESLLPKQDDTIDSKEEEDTQEAVGPEIDAIEEANQELADIMSKGEDEGEGGPEDLQAVGDAVKPSSRSQSVASKMSGYTKNIREIDIHGGDVDATHSMQTLGIKPEGVDSRTVSRQDGQIKETPDIILSETPKLGGKSQSVFEPGKEGTITETPFETSIQEDGIEIDEQGLASKMASRAGTKFSEHHQLEVASRQYSRPATQLDDEAASDSQLQTAEGTIIQEESSRVASRQVALEDGDGRLTTEVTNTDSKQIPGKAPLAYVQGDTMSSIAMTTKEPTKINREGVKNENLNNLETVSNFSNNTSCASSLPLPVTSDICSDPVDSSSYSMFEKCTYNLAQKLSSPNFHPSSSIDVNTVLPCARPKDSNESLSDRSRRSSQEASRRSSRALSEQELVEALSDHAHKIAETVLSRPETGEDLAKDAQRAANMWLDDNPPNKISSSMSMRNITGDALLEEMGLEREMSKSAEPSVDEYKELLKETLATVVSKVSGDAEADLTQAEVSPDLVEALANQEIAVEDIEITKDKDTGRTVIRAKSGASNISKKSSRSRQSLVIDVPSGELVGKRPGEEGSATPSKSHPTGPTPPITPKPRKTKTPISKEVSTPIPENAEQSFVSDPQTPTRSRRSPTKSPKKSSSPTKTSKEHSRVSVTRTPLPDEILEEEPSLDEASRENTINEEEVTAEPSIVKTPKAASVASKRGSPSKSPTKAPKSGTSQQALSKSPSKMSIKKSSSVKKEHTADASIRDPNNLGSREATDVLPSEESTLEEQIAKDPSALESREATRVSASREATQMAASKQGTQIAASKEATQIAASKENTLLPDSKTATPVAVSKEPSALAASKGATPLPGSKEATLVDPSKEATQMSTLKETSERGASEIALSKQPSQVSRDHTTAAASLREGSTFQPSTEITLTAASREPSDIPPSKSALDTAALTYKEDTMMSKIDRSKQASRDSRLSKMGQSRDPTQAPKEDTIASLDPNLAATKENSNFSRDGTLASEGQKENRNLTRGPSIVPAKSFTQVSDEPEREPTDTFLESTLSRDKTSDISTEEESGGEDYYQSRKGTDMSSRSHTMPKGKRPSVSKRPTMEADKEPGKTDLSMDVINYGEADLPEGERSEALVRPPQQDQRRRSSAAQSQKSGKGLTDIADEEDSKFRNNLENLVEGSKSGGQKSGKSDKSQPKSVKSKSPEEKEEFVVGKVKDKKEMENLYAPLEEPPKPTEKKPRVPAAKPVKPKKKKQGKKAAKEDKEKPKAAEETPETESTKAPTPEPVVQEVEKPPEPEATPSPQPTVKRLVRRRVKQPKQKAGLSKVTPRKKDPSPEPEQEEDIDFIIVRDEFSDDEEDEPVRTKSVKSYRSFKSVESKDTDISVQTKDSDMSEETRLKQISNRDARAAKRAAAASKKREEMERKRREREEKVKKDKEAQEQKENLERELEEDRRKREEERRNNRAMQEEEKRREEEEEHKRDERTRQEAEREKRLKEEYKRKMEETKLKKIEDDLRRKELEEQRRKEEAERAAEEAEMMAKMAEEERLEYEKKKAEEEELKRLKEQADRIKRELDAAKALEEAKKLAEEMARKQLEMERRLAFNRGLQLESTGLSRTQEVTRAFVWSYYELLKWLGLDVPEFEKWKATLKY